jgi:SOS response regulatory protein OraA/RecX
MILTFRKRSETDRNSLIEIDDSVWGEMPDKALRTLLADCGLAVTLLPLVGSQSLRITEQEYEKIGSGIRDFAWQKLLNWLAMQEHSVSECRAYLHRYSIHSTVMASCLEEAIGRNYIDDQRYCRLLIQSLIDRQKSPLQIKAKLIEKRLPSALWQPILTELTTPESKAEILQVQAEKIYRRFCHLERQICKKKCINALYTKGFNLSDARYAIEQLMADNQD